LAPGGILVFSIEHPYIKYFDHWESTNYFETDLVKYTWHGFGKSVDVPSYRRPRRAVINPLVDAGFTLDHILEPKPTEEFKTADPEGYAELMRAPGFMCIRAVRQ
jgi:hypothetical protein